MLSPLENKGRGMRGQVLSYDVIGSVAIFLIAMGILFVYWSSVGATFSEEDALLIAEANRVIDNVMRPGLLLEVDGITVNRTAFDGNCERLRLRDAGLSHENYELSVRTPGGRTVERCSNGSPGSKTAVAERVAYYEDARGDRFPVSVSLRVYSG